MSTREPVTRTQPPVNPLQRIRRASTASLVADQLRTAIMHGSLTPGSQLAEAELAGQLGVSRGPLREAMQRLVQEGLLRSEPNRGLFVITLDAADVQDIYQARSAIEKAAVSLILRGDHASAAARLAGIHRQMAEAASVDDWAAVSDADLRFHEELVVLSGSPRLANMHSTLLVETRMCLTALQQTDRPRTDPVLEHGGLVEGIRLGDSARMMALIDAHMEDALHRLIPTSRDENMRAQSSGRSAKGALRRRA